MATLDLLLLGLLVLYYLQEPVSQTLKPDSVRFPFGANIFPSFAVVSGVGPSLELIACFDP